MIKDLWSKIAYIWFVIMLIIVGFFVSSDKVNASELQSWATNQSRIVMDDHGTNSFTSWETNPYTFSSLSYPVKNVQFRLRTSDGFSADNSYTFTIQYVPTPDSLAVQSLVAFKDGDLSNTETITCTQWSRSTNGLYSSECSFQPHSNYTSSQYLWLAITFTQDYQNSVTLGVSKYDERLGVNAVITNQTNIINNSINSLIEQNNANTQSIIDSQQVCNYKTLDFNSSEFEYIGYLDNSGVLHPFTQRNDFKVSNYIHLTSLEVLEFESGGQYYTCFYKQDKTLISCLNFNQLTIGTITLPTDTYYGRFTIYQNGRPKYKLSVCKNGNQAVTDTVEDDSIDDPDEMFEDFEDLLPENGVITSLIGLPITLYQKVLNSINGTCSQFSLGSLYGTNLIMPCIDIDDYLGSTIWNLVDLIISGGFVLIISKKMIKAFNHFSSLKEGDVIND